MQPKTIITIDTVLSNFVNNKTDIWLPKCVEEFIYSKVGEIQKEIIW